MKARDKAAAPTSALEARALIKHSEEFRQALGNWYDRHQRPLPWRTHPSPYRTVVSELMLQQTRVETALPYFERWMAALPDFHALAAAPEGQVLKLWEGLGYYRRARNLQAIARIVVTHSLMPVEAQEWQQLPGVGAYTAAAIASIAFGRPAACVDGNVVRVLARLAGYIAPLKDSATAVRIFQPLADALLDTDAPGRHNQALMELGATACQRNPDCRACPVSGLCRARQLGLQDSIPAFPPRVMEKVEVTRIWCDLDGRILLSRSAPNAQRLADLCELPTAEQLGWCPANAKSAGKLLLKKKRSITRYAISESIFAVDEAAPASLPPNLFWAPIANIDALAFSGPHRRWISEILGSTRKST